MRKKKNSRSWCDNLFSSLPPHLFHFICSYVVQVNITFSMMVNGTREHTLKIPLSNPRAVTVSEKSGVDPLPGAGDSANSSVQSIEAWLTDDNKAQPQAQPQAHSAQVAAC